MTSTTIHITRKLEIIDKAAKILGTGGTCYLNEWGSGHYYTPYTCHALASAEYRDDGMAGVYPASESASVKEFMKFSAITFGLILVADETEIDFYKTPDECLPYWWNSSLPYIKERLEHLQAFRAYIEKELQ